jgi:hypothetical protein
MLTEKARKKGYTYSRLSAVLPTNFRTCALHIITVYNIRRKLDQVYYKTRVPFQRKKSQKTAAAAPSWLQKFSLSCLGSNQENVSYSYQNNAPHAAFRRCPILPDLVLCQIRRVVSHNGVGFPCCFPFYV